MNNKNVYGLGIMGLKNNAKKIKLLKDILRGVDNLDPLLKNYLYETYDEKVKNSLNPFLLEAKINNYLINTERKETVGFWKKRKINEHLEYLNEDIAKQTTALQNIYAKLDLTLPGDTPVDNTPTETPIMHIPDELLITDTPPTKTQVDNTPDYTSVDNGSEETPMDETSTETPILPILEDTPADDKSNGRSLLYKVGTGLTVAGLMLFGMFTAVGKFGDTQKNIEKSIDTIKYSMFEYKQPSNPFFDNSFWRSYLAFFEDLTQEGLDIELPDEIIEAYLSEQVANDDNVTQTDTIPETISDIKTINIYDPITNTTTEIPLSDFLSYFNEEAPITNGDKVENIYRPNLTDKNSNIKTVYLHGKHNLDEYNTSQIDTIQQNTDREKKGIPVVTENNNINIYTHKGASFFTSEDHIIRTHTLDGNLSELFTIYQIGKGGTTNIEFITTDKEGRNTYIEYLAKQTTELKDIIDENIDPNYRDYAFLIDTNRIIIEKDSVLFHGSYFDENGAPSLVQSESLKKVLDYKYNSVTFEFTLGRSEFNSKTIREYGLFYEDATGTRTMFSRIARTGINADFIKNANISVRGEWTVTINSIGAVPIYR